MAKGVLTLYPCSFGTSRRNTRVAPRAWVVEVLGCSFLTEILSVRGPCTHAQGWIACGPRAVSRARRVFEFEGVHSPVSLCRQPESASVRRR